MAALTSFNIVTRSKIKLPVTGAASEVPTRTPRLVHSGDTFRFGLSGAEVGGGMGGATAAAGALFQTYTVIDPTGVGADNTPFGYPSKLVVADDYFTTAPLANSVLGKHDHVTKTIPRPFPKLETFLEWWDHATLCGFAHAMTFTGTSGSPLVTVSDISLLTVGQAITSAGSDPIPAGTVIAGLYMTMTAADAAPTFTARLSKALINNATAVVGTLTGASLVASIPLKDYLWHGTGTPSSIN